MAQHELPKHFIQSSGSCLLLLDHDLRVVAFNETFVEFSKAVNGKTPVTGEQIADHIDRKYLVTFISSCKKALAGESQRVERIFNHEDHSILWQITYDPVPGPSGEIIGVSYTATDISKTLEHEQTIFLQNETLKQIAHLQSHQLRKPVSSILGLLNLLKLDGHLEKIPELTMLEKAVLELDDMIHKIINYAQVNNEACEVVQNKILQPVINNEEKKRLEALSRYNPYHITFKLSFDDLTDMALKITGAEIAMINFIDEHQQWSVAQQGADTKPVDRDLSICQYTIMEESDMEITCLAGDPRFHNNPELLKYQMQYYYGVPIRTADGHAIAAICVLSKTPRALNQDQKALMHLLAQQVIVRMDNMRRMEQLELQLAQLLPSDNT